MVRTVGIASCALAACMAATEPAAPGRPPDEVRTPAEERPRVEAESPAAEPEPEPRPVVMSREPFLDDDILEANPMRAVVVRMGRSGVTPDAFEPPDGPPGRLEQIVELPVAEEHPDIVRVVDEHYGVRYGLYIEKQDLAELPGQRSALARGPGEPAGSMAVEIAPGAPVIIRERKDGWVHVGLDTHGLAADGWLPADQLVRVFRIDDFNARSVPDNMQLVASTWITERPNGHRIAELRVSEHALRTIHDTGSSDQGFARIEVITDRARAEGYVPVDALAEKPLLGGFGFGRGGGWGASHTNWLRVPIQTLIHIEPDGPVFAMTVSEHSTLALTRERSGPWVGVRLRTPWRMVPGWVHCPAVRAVEQRRTSFECTRADDPDRVEFLPWP